jgi:RHS repeat-associated protein
MRRSDFLRSGAKPRCVNVHYQLANASASTPQKEYGYRNGELLITADAPTQSAQNVTWTNQNGVTVNGNSLTQNYGFGYYLGANATQTLSGDGYVEFTASAAVDGSDYRFVGLSHVATNYWQSIDFCWRLDPNGMANVCFGGYASGVMTSYTAGDKFRVAVEGGVIKFKKNDVTIYTAGAPTFPLYADASLWEIGATVNNAVSGSGGSPAQIHWLVTDQLGTPRMVFDQSGALANVSRHDYLPFGEELYAGTGGRTTTQGYVGDSTRQKFTKYERDNETGLDFAEARYFASVQGRFTSPDPFGGSATIANPQTFNRYAYVGNNPVNSTDPLGLVAQPGSRNIFNWNGAMASEEATEGISPWPDSGDGGDTSKDAHTIGSEGKVGHYGGDEGKDGHEATPGTTTAVVDVIGGDSFGALAQGWHSGRGLNFSELWMNHPGVQGLPRPCGDSIENACATRLSVALQDSGMDMSSYNAPTCATSTGKRLAMGALPLAKWLASPKRLGAPEKFKDGWAAFRAISGRSGIIYIRQFVGVYDPKNRYDHIDLWNGGDLGKGAIQWITNYPKEVWFWRIK